MPQSDSDSVQSLPVSQQPPQAVPRPAEQPLPYKLQGFGSAIDTHLQQDAVPHSAPEQPAALPPSPRSLRYQQSLGGSYPSTQPSTAHPKRWPDRETPFQEPPQRPGGTQPPPAQSHTAPPPRVWPDRQTPYQTPPPQAPRGLPKSQTPPPPPPPQPQPAPEQPFQPSGRSLSTPQLSLQPRRSLGGSHRPPKGDRGYIDTSTAVDLLSQPSLSQRLRSTLHGSRAQVPAAPAQAAAGAQRTQPPADQQAQLQKPSAPARGPSGAYPMPSQMPPVPQASLPPGHHAS